MIKKLMCSYHYLMVGDVYDHHPPRCAGPVIMGGHLGSLEPSDSALCSSFTVVLANPWHCTALQGIVLDSYSSYLIYFLLKRIPYSETLVVKT